MSGAYYHLVKEVYGVKYYWNVENSRWEGLKDNGTAIHHESARQIAAEKKKEGAELKYSHTK